MRKRIFFLLSLGVGAVFLSHSSSIGLAAENDTIDQSSIVRESALDTMDSQLNMNSNKDSLTDTSLFNSLSENDKAELKKLMSSKEKSPRIIGKAIAHILYPYIFENNINDNSGEMKGPYEKEFKEGLKWFQEIPKEEWIIKKDDGDLRSYYLKNKVKTTKTVVLIHGFSSQPLYMGAWAKVFYDLGYNVLAPELQGHGKSTIKSRSFGAKDKYDILEWINKVNDTNGAESEIVISGDSMGASLSLMMGSMKDLPKNVTAIIEDCGYSDLTELFRHMLQKLGFLKEPIIKELNNLSVKRQGVSLDDISPIKDAASSTIPLLIIHGDADFAVPTSMAEDIFNASIASKKKLVLIEGAGHPTSIVYDLPTYKNEIKNFLTTN
ncbi:alpha/beta hydrolase [Enterococcus quebecensis]|uniref:BD-FAE-like domain-containing protein n=1 Tax=Enterococcus quebecensis TaxID=903983 RepID=A0A1E5H445_9ENTE|nr:alpha/beta hydrolase [Enterococcus quebecensis]OEG19605.1 hypothetical protein BCR23_02635 [Enterococcus quebecensis]OJG75113.1 hypothetical protein RV12_GL001718 [Enterococcus quebecensis]